MTGDVLKDDVWLAVHNLWKRSLDDGLIEQLPPPLLALHQALGILELEWTAPYELSGGNGTVFCCDGGTPAMMKRVLTRRYKAIRKEKLSAALLGRWENTRQAGTGQLQALCKEVDVEACCDLIMSTSVPVTLKKSFMAVAWSVYPTGAWLAEHGWATEGRCPTCGGLDDIVHAFAGCHEETQDNSIEECLNNWE